MTKWKISQRIEQEYKTALNKVIRQLALMTHASPELTRTPADTIKLIEKLVSSKAYKEFSIAIVRRMITGLYADNVRTWRQAATKSMKGREIYSLLEKELNGSVGVRVRQLVEANANYVRTFPLDVAKSVLNDIKSESLAGKRAGTIAKEFLTRFPKVSKARIELIARTETSKASTALTQARADELGLNWYVWRTSEDKRVRESHAHMEDVLIPWDNPPDPEELIGVKPKQRYGNYHAGNVFNCRCYPEPVIMISDIKFPHKVYFGGQIQTMTLKRFKQISGLMEYGYAA